MKALRCQESLAKQCYDGGLSYEEKAAKRQEPAWERDLSRGLQGAL